MLLRFCGVHKSCVVRFVTEVSRIDTIVSASFSEAVALGACLTNDALLRPPHSGIFFAILSLTWCPPCARNDRKKMPLWGGRSRRIISQTGS